MPGVKSTGPTIDASLPFINQLRLLVQPSELRGLATDLSVTVPALARLTNATIPLMKNGVRPASSCVANIIYPVVAADAQRPHFNASNGFPPHKVYVEAVDYLPGLAGESRDFDANGPYIRVLGNGGTFTYSLPARPVRPGAVEDRSACSPALPPGRQAPAAGAERAVRDASRRSPTCRAPVSAPPQQVSTQACRRPGASSCRWTSALIRRRRARSQQHDPREPASTCESPRSPKAIGSNRK